MRVQEIPYTRDPNHNRSLRTIDKHCGDCYLSSTRRQISINKKYMSVFLPHILSYNVKKFLRIAKLN